MEEKERKKIGNVGNKEKNQLIKLSLCILSYWLNKQVFFYMFYFIDTSFFSHSKGGNYSARHHFQAIFR